ncbi:MAG: VPS10 domain-containing protein [Gemmataceae bacterium]
MRCLLPFTLLLLVPAVALPYKQEGASSAEKKAPEKPADPLTTSDTYGGLKLRAIGPAVCSGRVVDISVHPDNKNVYYVAVASGGVWKTVNNGTSWTPIFDDQGSSSIGCVVVDPRNPNTVWVGSGENNSQRSVGYGDGVYKSLDGGASWKKVGLERSEHIGKILIDPRDSNTVYIAAQGPLWSAGGDRGLYKTTDGGKTWTRILHVSENTGITDVVCDPRNPDILLAASYQRRRHVWTLINGGPECGMHRSVDGGKTWTKITAGLPGVDMGRISLRVAPAKPDVVYATIEAASGKGGVFRSDNGGLSWERRNPYDRGAMYFSGVNVDPKNSDRLFIHGVRAQVSEDGGKTFRPIDMKHIHVDTHTLWINPDHTDHYRIGCDGGVYETLDRGKNWRYMANLPVTQFYDLTVDNTAPFYHVYGGTQDNNTLGGPARTRSVHGGTNADWFVVHGGDGFQCKVDPRDPNTVYGEAQYGDLVRFDRRTGEAVGIRPHPLAGEPPLRWNWDSPLVLSPHAPTRLYYAANRVFRSDDRGDSWRAISPDLTRQIDRDRLPVMGKVWSPDAVAKHQSTSLFGNLVALSESPKSEDTLYAGTDDGLIHVTTDAGKIWRKYEKFPGVPEGTYVSRLLASQHDANTVYATFSNHKNGDFKPYVLKSTDRGETWVSLASNLPENGPVWAIVEDPVEPNLLFLGNEFGLHFTIDGGRTWTRLRGGLPTIAVRDLVIHSKMHDLVLATFGRGFYVLDDLTPLRKLTREKLTAPAALFPVREAWQYIPTRQYGLRGKAFLGDSFFTADNPPYGAVFTYHLAEKLTTRKDRRQEAEKKAGESKDYPSMDSLRAEAEEEAPAVVLEVRDAEGNVIRRLNGPTGKGFHRVAWDLRTPAATLSTAAATDDDGDLLSTPEGGILVLPGTYSVRLLLLKEGKWQPVDDAAQEFRVVPYGSTTSPEDRKALHDFQKEVLTLKRAVLGSLQSAEEMQKVLKDMRRAIDQTPTLTARDRDRVTAMEAKLRLIQRVLRGDTVLRERNENTPNSISDRINAIVEDQYFSLSAPTQTHRQLFREASVELTSELEKLRSLREKEIAEMEKILTEAGAPWTPGRLPQWKAK